MSDLDITLFYNEHRLAALERILSKQDATIEQKAGEALDRLYEQIVPAEERAEIEARITRETQLAEIKREAARRFVMIHLHDEDDDFHFTTEYPNDLYGIACVYRSDMQDEVGRVTLDSLARHFGEYQPIDDLTASTLCRAISNDEHIAALVDMDFENSRLLVCEQGDKDWRLYDLKDLSTAVYKAERKQGLPPEARKEIFQEELKGRLIASYDDQDEIDELFESGPQM